jgi:DNA polymerase-3 subunit epsilon
MQRSFEDLGTPLHDVTFCVVDLETTGGSPKDCSITEVGAVKLRGGECLGTFQTLVNPGAPIPPFITVLTGITTAMVLPAPRIAEVLPAFLEFAHGTVLVGHNLRFDLSFLNAALAQHGRPRLAHRWVDTAALARRLVRDEVPNCKLGTLASRLRLDHTPTHRALDDALATGDLLHLMLERAGRLGVTGLDDLLTLPKLAGHPQVAKLRLTERLPRTPGVYLFRDAGDRVLYVGKASNLRTRVRSYFSGDDRRKVGPLLREARCIDHIPCASALEAGVLEVRLIHELLPRYNRQVKRWRSYVYVKLTNERFPRLSVVRTPKPGGELHLGPLPSSRAAKQVVEAIETAVPIRRCTATPGKVLREAPCAAAQLGVSTCPCSGAIDEVGYAAIVATVVRGLTTDPDALLAPLATRMRALARDGRFEEAADVRDRADALARALRRQRRFDGLRASGRLVIEVPGQHGAELAGGRLVRAWTGPVAQEALPFDVGGDAPVDGPVPRHLADELACVASWLEANAARVRLVHCDEGLHSRLPVLPSFAAAPAR